MVIVPSMVGVTPKTDAQTHTILAPSLSSYSYSYSDRMRRRLPRWLTIDSHFLLFPSSQSLISLSQYYYHHYHYHSKYYSLISLSFSVSHVFV